MLNRSRPYNTVEVGGLEFVNITDPVKVYTPSGSRSFRCRVGAYHLPPDRTMEKDIQAIKAIHRRATHLTSGEWYQILLRLEETNDEIAQNMRGPTHDRTATILDYEHGKKVVKKSGSYFDGLVIEHPETDKKGNFVYDGDILRARDVWEMPLPLEPLEQFIIIGKMPKIFDKFLDTIYGMKNARNEVRGGYVEIDLPSSGNGLVNLIRGPKIRFGGISGVDVRIEFDPSFSAGYIASRAIIKSMKR